PAPGAGCRRAALRPRHPCRALDHRPALLDLDPRAHPARGAGARAHDRPRLRGADGDGALDTAGALRAHRPALPALRHAVLAAGAVPRLLLRPGVPLAGAVAAAAALLVRLERAGGDLGRGGGALRARVRQPAAVLAQGVPRLWLAGARLRGA